MLRKILSISGRPGLYKLVSQGRNMLIVESLLNGNRNPAYAHDKVVSLGDIAIYTKEEEVPLSDVLEALREKNDGKPLDIKSFNTDSDVREYFSTILPDFDQDRVYTNDIKKIFSWYNLLTESGFDKFKEEKAEDQADSEEDKTGSAK